MLYSYNIYMVLLLWLYNLVMCVYVDNYVDNFNINVDNFLLHLQHFYELFWKCCIFACFRTLSLIISCLLLLSHFFIILLSLTILYIQFNCSLGRYELSWTIFFILFWRSNCFISITFLYPNHIRKKSNNNKTWLFYTSIKSVIVRFS